MITFPDGVSLVLGSGSPRRLELLTRAGIGFVVRPADIDESPHEYETPTEYVRRLSLEKSAAVIGPNEIVVAADTTVECDGRVLEKPVDDADAAAMLRVLSDRDHHVHTGVAIRSEHVLQSFVVTTTVTFVELTPQMIEWYVGTGEARDKAGAYGIQGAAASFVERVEGSVTNVIGLPMAETLAMLRVVAET